MEHRTEILTVTDAARLLAVSSDRVRQLERAGVLPATKTAGGMRLFVRADVEALRQKRAAESRPR